MAIHPESIDLYLLITLNFAAGMYKRNRDYPNW